MFPQHNSKIFYIRSCNRRTCRIQLSLFLSNFISKLTLLQSLKQFKGNIITKTNINCISRSHLLTTNPNSSACLIYEENVIKREFFQLPNKKQIYLPNLFICVLFKWIQIASYSPFKHSWILRDNA